MTQPTRIAPRLYIGPRPEQYDIRLFDMVVLAARSFQPQLPHYRGQVIRAGISDTLIPINELEQQKVTHAAKRVARALYDGDKVLVTCEMGWNRSSLVAGLALRMCSNLSVTEIVELIRKCRGDMALSNDSFVDYLYTAPVSQAY